MFMSQLIYLMKNDKKPLKIQLCIWNGYNKQMLWNNKVYMVKKEITKGVNYDYKS